MAAILDGPEPILAVLVALFFGVVEHIRLPATYHACILRARKGVFQEDRFLKPVKSHLLPHKSSALLGLSIATGVSAFVLRFLIFFFVISGPRAISRAAPWAYVLPLISALGQILGFIVFKQLAGIIAKKTLANTHGVVTYNIGMSWFMGIFTFTGLLSGLVAGALRAILAVILALNTIHDLTESVLPYKVISINLGCLKKQLPLAKFDAGFMAWWSFIRLRHVHCNPIWKVFIHEYMQDAQRKPDSTPCREEAAATRTRRRLKRSVFLSSNPTLLLMRPAIQPENHEQEGKTVAPWIHEEPDNINPADMMESYMHAVKDTHESVQEQDNIDAVCKEAADNDKGAIGPPPPASPPSAPPAFPPPPSAPSLAPPGSFPSSRGRMEVDEVHMGIAAEVEAKYDLRWLL